MSPIQQIKPPVHCTCIYAHMHALTPYTHTHTQPDKELGRGWAVLHQSSAKPAISFYQDNRKETKVLKKDKIEVHVIREVAKVIDHPKHPYAISLKCKGSKRLLLHCDKE